VAFFPSERGGHVGRKNERATHEKKEKKKTELLLLGKSREQVKEGGKWANGKGKGDALTYLGRETRGALCGGGSPGL